MTATEKPDKKELIFYSVNIVVRKEITKLWKRENRGGGEVCIECRLYAPSCLLGKGD